MGAGFCHALRAMLRLGEKSDGRIKRWRQTVLVLLRSHRLCLWHGFPLSLVLFVLPPFGGAWTLLAGLRRQPALHRCAPTVRCNRCALLWVGQQKLLSHSW